MAIFFNNYIDATPPPYLGNDLSNQLHSSQSQHYLRHDVISAPGLPASHVYLIRCGWVRISLNANTGQELTLAILGRGQLFGEMEVLYDMSRKYTVVALSPCEVKCIGADRFKRSLKDEPAMLEQLLYRLALRMRWTEEQMQGITSLSVSARLAHLLLLLSGEAAAPASIPVRLTHYDLATLIASIRETITATLGEFRRMRLIEFDRAGLRIIDRHRLAVIAMD